MRRLGVVALQKQIILRFIKKKRQYETNNHNNSSLKRINRRGIYLFDKNKNLPEIDKEPNHPEQGQQQHRS